MKILATLLFATAFFLPQLSHAAALNADMQKLVNGYMAEARKKDPSFAFSAEEGKKFFMAKRQHSNGETRSCTTCHTADPKQKGKTPVGKVIEPIAPSANKDRFTDPRQVEKWFKRNCQWVLERECTPAEKGNIIQFMLSN